MKKFYYSLFLCCLLFCLVNTAFSQCQASAAQSPSIAVSVPFAGSAFPFNNPSSIFSNNGQAASAVSLLTLLSGKTEYLQAKGFGFSIPSNAFICGIEAKITRSAEGINILSIVQDYKVQLVKNGTMVGDNLARNDFWGLIPEIKPYGAAGNTWNTAWTPADINSPNFGISISAQMAGLLSLLPMAKISGVQVTVYYGLLLPVHITDFNLTPAAGQIVLNWSLTELEPHTRWIIERSNDGVSWHAVYDYLYTGAATATLQESFTDKPGSDKTNLYRLKIIQPGGAIVVSNILKYSAPEKTVHLSVYPNPAKEKITIGGRGAGVLTLYNASGVAIKQFRRTVNSSLSVDISLLPKGLYIVKADNNEHSSFIKN